MNHLHRTTALALLMGSFAFAAHAEDMVKNPLQSDGTSQVQQDSSSGTATPTAGDLQADNSPLTPEELCKSVSFKADSDGNGYVSRDELKAAAKAEFKALDKDGDGQISQDEYSNCRSNMNGLKSAQVDRTAESFDMADTDHDGSVDKQEFMTGAQQAYVNRYPSANTGQSASAGGDMKSGQAMTSSDSTQAASNNTQLKSDTSTNQSASLDDGTPNASTSPKDSGADTAMNAKTDTGSSSSNAPSATTGSSMSASSNAGGSGTDNVGTFETWVWLSPDEANNAQSLDTMSEDEAAGRSAMAFNALDRDHDGKISKQEWQNASPVSGNDDVMSTAMNSRFKSADSDKSGTLSEEEYETAKAGMIDPTTTASTKSGSAGSATPKTNMSNDGNSTSMDKSGDASEDKGIPVYVYHFMTY